MSLSIIIMPLEERHKGRNIADWLEETATKFHIPFEKVKTVVLDNVANVVFRILKERYRWASVKCTGHTLNLIVQNMIKSNKTISSCVASARCPVKYLKINWPAQNVKKSSRKWECNSTRCKYSMEQYTSCVILNRASQ